MTDAEKTVTVQIKPWYKSKTTWVGIIAAVAAGTDALLEANVLGSYAADVVVMALGVLQVILRKLTSQPIG